MNKEQYYEGQAMKDKSVEDNYYGPDEHKI